LSETVRICPLCGKHNPPEETFCICGTLLSEVDFTYIDSTPESDVKPTAPVSTTPATQSIICPNADCAQPNSPGSQRCVYCNRLLEQPEAKSEAEQLQNVLPTALQARFTVLEVLPSEGAQADLILIETKQSGTTEKRMLKIYRKGIKPDWQVFERLKSISNSHLVKVFEHAVSEGTSYEIMEYCSAGTLRNVIDAGMVSKSIIRTMIEQLSITLSELHAHQILHRDIKPENILLRSRSPLEIALSDFGASSIKMATQYFTGGARTVSYSAPEVLTGILDEKSDWWSFGMIVLEAFTGRHPYTGLSEQVVLHQLATESIDVSGVYDDSMRMLCRGLLLRNPKKRWGASEVARWLANDETLSMPEDSGDGKAIKPYTLIRSQCLTRIDLALALARYWQEGKKDLMRGVIMRWVENDLRDFNLAREINDTMIRNGLSDDARLLRVIVSALPGIPPIWCGRVITQQTLARSAKQAIDGNGDELGWLLSIYKEDVLDVLAEHGNADMEKISKEWKQGVEDYRRIWERSKLLEEEWRRRPRSRSKEVADIDYLMFLAPIRMTVPSLNQIIPDLVLALYIPEFSVSAKKTVHIACESKVSHCGWFTSLVDEVQDNFLGWSVLQRLLPFAMEDSEKEHTNQQLVVKNADIDVMSVFFRIQDTCKQLLRNDNIDEFDEWSLDKLRNEISKWMELVTWVKGLDHDNAKLRNLNEKLDAVTMRVMQFSGYLDDHQHLLEINHIWIRPGRLFFGLSIVSCVAYFSNFLAGILFVISIIGIIWRLNAAKKSKGICMMHLRRMLDSVDSFYEQNLKKL
jgi:hypothetical protein